MLQGQVGPMNIYKVRFLFYLTSIKKFNLHIHGKKSPTRLSNCCFDSKHILWGHVLSSVCEVGI